MMKERALERRIIRRAVELPFHFLQGGGKSGT